MKALLTAVFLLAAVDASSAQSGKDMFDGCKNFVETTPSPQLALKSGLCVGTITGMSYIAKSLPQNMKWCLPAGVTNLQQGRAVVTFFEANPGRLTEDYRDLVMAALRQTWPCP
jgi:Ssp1 endopeptidase immunity protein Rap1a